MKTWAGSVNQQLGSAGIRDVSGYLQRESNSSISAIDRFYNALTAYLRLGTSSALAGNPMLGPLLSIGVLSITEQYFRDIFSGVLKLCPSARKRASREVVSFGSILWYNGNDIEKGAFERVPFSDPENIRDAAKKYLDYVITDQSPLAAHLRNFAQVCEMRHCIVHSDGYLQGKNALQLQVAVAAKGFRMRVAVGYPQFQEISDICAGMVRAFNTDLFKLICTRWATDWRKAPNWTTENENKLFRSIWNIFYSDIDAGRGAITPKYGMMKCRNEVKRAFGIY